MNFFDSILGFILKTADQIWDMILRAFGREGTHTCPPDSLDLSDLFADGKTDDTVEFQRLLEQSSKHGNPICLKRGMKIRTTGPLYAWKKARITGPKNHTAEIILDAVLTGGKRWINFGTHPPPPPAEGEEEPKYPVLRWTGSMECVKLVVRPQCNYLEQAVTELVYIHAGDGFTIDNCFFDQTRMDQLAGNCIKTGYALLTENGAGVKVGPGRITNNRLYGRTRGCITKHGGAGINLSDAFDIEIMGNVIDGFGDDAIYLVDSMDCTVEGNDAKGVESRIGAEGGSGHTFKLNTLERQPGGIDGHWAPTSTFFSIRPKFLEQFPSKKERKEKGYSPNQRVFQMGPAPRCMKLIKNTAILPKAAPKSKDRIGLIYIAALQGCEQEDGTVVPSEIRGNILINESDQEDLKPGLIITAVDATIPSLRIPRHIDVTGNIIEGEVGGTIWEDKSLESPNVVYGPIVYRESDRSRPIRQAKTNDLNQSRILS